MLILLFLILFFLLFPLFLAKKKQKTDMVVVPPPKAFLLSAPQQMASGVVEPQQGEATTQTPEDPTMIYDDMNGSTVEMRVGEKRKLLLPGNATTGYRWRIVSLDGKSVSSPHKWKYRLSSPFLMGSGGYFQKEFIAVEPGTTEVYLIYDPVAEPQLGYYFYLRFDVY